MNLPKKIYVTLPNGKADPLIHYATTEIAPLRTRAEIDSLLAIYGVYQVAWNWRPEINDIWVQFNIIEEINGIPIKVSARVACNILWNRASKNAHTPEKRVESPNVEVSVRAMYYYIKAALQASYTMGSSKVSAFLPNIVNSDGKTVEQIFIPQIISPNSQYALEYKDSEVYRPDVKQITQKPINITKL